MIHKCTSTQTSYTVQPENVIVFLKFHQFVMFVVINVVDLAQIALMIPIIALV